MASNLELLASVTGKRPIVTVDDGGTVTVTVHGETATYVGTGPDLASACRKILDVLGA